MKEKKWLNSERLKQVNLLDVVVKGKGLNDFNPGVSVEGCGLNACNYCGGTSETKEHISNTHNSNYNAWAKSPDFTPL